jgi:DeoR family transcriptional regulator, aga operon transcriptional repressor
MYLLAVFGNTVIHYVNFRAIVWQKSKDTAMTRQRCPARGDEERWMRDTSDRRQKTVTMIQDRGSVQVLSLSAQFGVSTQTIRKDLLYLEGLGVATRCYGGAISAQAVGIVAETAVEAKRTLRASDKERIGRAAAALVKPGESIILDSGTTTVQIARFLPDREDIVVVTNDAEVLAQLMTKEHIQIVVLGGALRRKNMAFYGAQTEAALESLHVDKLFLGVDGLDLGKGITTHFESEAILNRKMARVAAQVIAVTDSSKVGRVCLHRIIGIDDVNILMTDANVPDDFTKACEAVACEVMVA